jgi:hypothetical protein
MEANEPLVVDHSANDPSRARAHTLRDDNRNLFIALAPSDTTISRGRYAKVAV